MSENNTHVATTPNKAITPLESLKRKMAGKYLDQIKNYYAGNSDEALRFITAAVDYIRGNPKLLNTSPDSLLSALVTSAQFRFMPSGVSGEAYIIPYGSEAKFQMGYQGIVTLLYRSGKIKGITANIVYENDDFEFEEGLESFLKHKPVFGKDRGEAIGVYTVAQMDGGIKTFKVMDKQSVLGIKNLSKAKNSAESPWNSKLDPELWMWKKTCLIQHAKTLPKSAELVKALEADYDGEGMDKPRFDVDSLASKKSSHEPENLDTTEENTE